jgi:hypothetical protein
VKSRNLLKLIHSRPDGRPFNSIHGSSCGTSQQVGLRSLQTSYRPWSISAREQRLGILLNEIFKPGQNFESLDSDLLVQELSAPSPAGRNSCRKREVQTDFDDLEEVI